jgi:serine/threonine protein kinase
MRASDHLGPYTLLQDFTTAGGGQCRWTFARRGGKDYFLKEFLRPTYPGADGPGSPATKHKKVEQCEAFERRHRAVMAELAPLSRSGGHLVVAVDLFRAGPRYYKVTEKVDVATETPAQISRLDIEEQVPILLAAVGSVGVLHRAGLVHGDIKPPNLLVKRSSAGSYSARLIDFDDCFFSGNAPPIEDMVGDVTYHSPELLGYLLGEMDGRQLGTASDVFALGLVFAEYLVGRLPTWRSSDYQYPAEAVSAGQALTVGRRGLSPNLRELLAGMLALQPALRPSCAEVWSALKTIQRRRGEPEPEPSAEPGGDRKPVLRSTIRRRDPSPEPPDVPPELRSTMGRKRPRSG